MNRAARRPVRFRRQEAGLEDLLHCLKEGLPTTFQLKRARFMNLHGDWLKLIWLSEKNG
jgi:hypothetical protein